MNKRKTAALAVSAASVIAFCLFLFFNSAQDAETSTEISDIFTDRIVALMMHLGIECKPLTVSFYVRKCAHFLGYFALTFLIYSLLKRFVSKKLALAISPAISFLVAVFDEFVIQQSSSGRSPEWRDVWIDLFGALTAIAAITVAKLLKNKRK